jgi:hypothetical protein
MIGVLSAAWTAVRGWFSGVSVQLAMAVGGLILAGALVLAVYKAGHAAAEADGLRRLAAENAAVAAQYREQFIQTQDTVARERARAEALVADNEKLKEQVHAIAKGDASPGVDLAVRGMQSHATKNPVVRVPGARK